MKPQYKDDLFPYLNWILKKSSKTPEEHSIPSIFITNRWLSMADNSLAQIVNVTFNRWMYKTPLSKENFLAGKFYKTLLPKISCKLSYIKKASSKSKEEDSDANIIANNMELSQREINLYNSTLEQLNKSLK